MVRFRSRLGKPEAVLAGTTPVGMADTLTCVMAESLAMPCLLANQP
jgi:hypothetical protein